ncbi:polyprenyl synthetase family protein [Kribbella sp. NPDC051586]|uniref:polyprenyl synthetase family protein n=1 Tax=Kribbella sp. NPDC051586 TaxID=3364118 RepID=UPI0037B8A7AD
MVKHWWNVQGDEGQKPRIVELREAQWDFYEEHVVPTLFRLLNHELSDAVGSQLKQRLRYSARFRPSQLLYAFSQDWELRPDVVIWASASLELLYLGRVILDDVADQHDQRWGLPAVRRVFDDASAVQIANLLQHTAVLCATNIDALSGERSAIPAAGVVAEYGRQINAAMLEELQWRKSTIAETSYKSIALRKVSSGQLTIDLLRLIAPADHAADLAKLAVAIENLDFAASITNDVTESNLRRGLEEVRFLGGERRGKKSEIQLNRPTIFSVILASDEFLLRNPEVGLALPDFTNMKLPEIFTYLDDTGAIRDAEHRIAALEQTAMPLIQRNTNVYTLLDRARTTNPTDEPPQVES